MRWRAEDGCVVTLGGVGLTVTAVVLVLLADLTAYLVAAARASAGADAAALAAVAHSDPRVGAPGIPVLAARRAAAANGGSVRRCDCAPGAAVVEVAVAVPVRAIAVTRYAARTAVATARAHAVGPPLPFDGRPLRRPADAADGTGVSPTAATDDRGPDARRVRPDRSRPSGVRSPGRSR